MAKTTNCQGICLTADFRSDAEGMFGMDKVSMGDAMPLLSVPGLPFLSDGSLVYELEGNHGCDCVCSC